MKQKNINALSQEDLKEFPIWKYVDRSSSEVSVAPVMKVPVNNLSNKLVATRVRLSNGSLFWAVLGNLDVSNPILTKHFLSLSVLSEKRWFHLARYHDFDFTDRGPDVLANFLNLPISEIFPIKYDVSQFLTAEANVTIEQINAIPDEILTREQLIELAGVT